MALSDVFVNLVDAIASYSEAQRTGRDLEEARDKYQQALTDYENWQYENASQAFNAWQEHANNIYGILSGDVERKQKYLNSLASARKKEDIGRLNALNTTIQGLLGNMGNISSYLNPYIEAGQSVLPQKAEIFNTGKNLVNMASAYLQRPKNTGYLLPNPMDIRK